MTTDTAVHIEQLRIAYHDALCTFALAEKPNVYGTGVTLSRERCAYEQAVINLVREGKQLGQRGIGVQIIADGPEHSARDMQRVVALLRAEIPEALRLAGVSDLALE